VSGGVTPGAFRRLAAHIQTAPPARGPEHWPYPLPEAEMVARYGLRRLTAEERAIFPGLRLVLQTFKARLTRPPAVMPAARAGWVVWVAETYPGSYLVRLPGGVRLLAPYHEMGWMAVAPDTPATTLSAAQAMAQRARWRQTLPAGLRRSLALPPDSRGGRDGISR
jgi:hypothetical protein